MPNMLFLRLVYISPTKLSQVFQFWRVRKAANDAGNPTSDWEYIGRVVMDCQDI